MRTFKFVMAWVMLAGVLTACSPKEPVNSTTPEAQSAQAPAVDTMMDSSGGDMATDDSAAMDSAAEFVDPEAEPPSEQ